MTKEYFIQIAGYNVWANKIVHSWLEGITEEQWNQPIVSGFPSIATTVIHVVSAETIWLDRLNNVPLEKQVWLSNVFKGSKKEAIDLWEKASLGFEKFIKEFDESKMQEELWFKRLNGQEFTMPRYQIFAHMLNHSTYHRGQLVTMLRQVGFNEVSSTDLLQYFRK